MLWRMIRGALLRQWSKMLLIALTIALGASLATSMINVMLDVGDKVNEELKAYGANIVVKPRASSLLSEIYDVEDAGAELQQAWLRENELKNLKTIFWAFNIRDFAPFVTVNAEVNGHQVAVVGTWFHHHLSLPTGEEVDTGVRNLRSWWDLAEEDWIDEQKEGADREILVGTTLAEQLNLRKGDTGCNSNGPKRNTRFCPSPEPAFRGTRFRAKSLRERRACPPLFRGRTSASWDPG